MVVSPLKFFKNFSFTVIVYQFLILLMYYTLFNWDYLLVPFQGEFYLLTFSIGLRPMLLLLSFQGSLLFIFSFFRFPFYIEMCPILLLLPFQGVFFISLILFYLFFILFPITIGSIQMLLPIQGIFLISLFLLYLFFQYIPHNYRESYILN